MFVWIESDHARDGEDMFDAEDMINRQGAEDVTEEVIDTEGMIDGQESEDMMNAEVMIDGQDGEDMSLVQDVDESGSNSSQKSMYGKI